jgi:hypothetical protein
MPSDQSPTSSSGIGSSSTGPPKSDSGFSENVQVELTAYHFLTFCVMLGGGLLFLALLLYFNGDMALQTAVWKVVKRLFKTVAVQQLTSILGAMAFVRYGLEPVIKSIRNITKAQGSWEKSSEYYILREV